MPRGPPGQKVASAGLRSASLRNTNLREAVFEGTDLRGAGPLLLLVANERARAYYQGTRRSAHEGRQAQFGILRTLSAGPVSGRVREGLRPGKLVTRRGACHHATAAPGRMRLAAGSCCPDLTFLDASPRVHRPTVGLAGSAECFAGTSPTEPHPRWCVLRQAESRSRHRLVHDSTRPGTVPTDEAGPGAPRSAGSPTRPEQRHPTCLTNG